MGSSLTRSLEPTEVAASPAASKPAVPDAAAARSVEPTEVAASRAAPKPTPPEAGEASAAAEPGPLFKGCWSCRLLSGTGLIGAGAYVYLAARRPMKLGYAPGPGTIAQMVVGISIAGWGVVILTDPKGKAYRVG